MAVRLLRAILGAALLAIAAPAALAQTNGGADADARKLELARRYYADTHMDRNMEAVFRSMTPAIAQSLAKANPNMSQQDRDAIAQAVLESTRAWMSKVVDRMTPIIAETFTEKELSDLVAFYEGPTGRAVVDKAPLLMSKFAPQLAELLPEMEVDLRQRVCAKVDCSKLAHPPGTEQRN